MNESDWKTFKLIKDEALSVFCTRALDDAQDAISDTTKPAHDRYLLLHKLVQNHYKEMTSVFNDHSRSNALLQLTAIRAHGLVDESMLAELSSEVRDRTDPKRFT